MRESISAQSCASVPPAPALMVKMQLHLSCGPLRKVFSSNASRSANNLLRSRLHLGFELQLHRLPARPAPSSSMTRKSSSCFAEAGERLEFAADVVGLVDDFLRGFLVVPEIFAGSSAPRVRRAVGSIWRRQRNLRKWVSLSAAVEICGRTMSNIGGEYRSRKPESRKCAGRCQKIPGAEGKGPGFAGSLAGWERNIPGAERRIHGADRPTPGAECPTPGFFRPLPRFYSPLLGAERPLPGDFGPPPGYFSPLLGIF